MKSISYLIKPASSSCNMNCTYCFYHDISENRLIKNYGMMSIETAKVIIDKAFDYIGNNGSINFAFQGGEPLLVGFDFYKEFVSYVNEKLAKLDKVIIDYALQTNGVLITEEFAKFFNEHNFLIGVSLDGDKVIHNQNRKYNNGDDTYSDVINSIKLLEDYKVEFNILTVVTKTVARKITSIYREYVNKGFMHLQFIPCIDKIEYESNLETKYNLTSKDYSLFLKTLLKLWKRDYLSGVPVTIRFFEDILSNGLNIPQITCTARGICSMQNVVEANGDVYPCDFYVLDDYKIGNIRDIDFNTLHTNKLAMNFIKESMDVSDDCKRCQYYQLCRNGCRRQRNEEHKLVHCDALKDFFENTRGDFADIVNHILKGQNK